MRNKLLVLIILLINLNFIIAQIPTYHQFYGSVIDSEGNVVDKNLDIEAYINETLVGSVTTKNGTYGEKVLFFVEDGENGDLIEFFINDILSGNYTFMNEETTELDLVWPCGNGIFEKSKGEQCDSDAIPSNCRKEGYDSGVLKCTFDCKLDFSDCKHHTGGGGGS
ncbi:hypothetical protein GF386_00005, partial [Candidatus Pacearchaeota archaeon]|nr:hypothetical protein [Candidatus Pacearchaeota archaeon]MBD3282662.1 hypothetical protein [Candidatus Pacearchaeota archaeon]